MESLILKILSQIPGATAGTLLGAGGLWVAYQLGNRLIKVYELKKGINRDNGGNGKGKENARIIVMQEIQGCQVKHETRIKEMENRILEATGETHKRIDTILLELVKRGGK